MVLMTRVIVDSIVRMAPQRKRDFSDAAVLVWPATNMAGGSICARPAAMRCRTGQASLSHCRICGIGTRTSAAYYTGDRSDATTNDVRLCLPRIPFLLLPLILRRSVDTLRADASRCSSPERHPLIAGFLPAIREQIVRDLEGHDLILALGAPEPSRCTVWTPTQPER